MSGIPKLTRDFFPRFFVIILWIFERCCDKVIVYEKRIRAALIDFTQDLHSD